MAETIKRASAKHETESVTERKMDNAVQESHLEERRQRIIGKVRNYVQITFDEMHVASRKDTNNLLEGLKHMTDKDIDGWEAFVDGEMQNMITSARKLYDQLMDPLLEALHDKAISERVISKIFAEFRSEDIDYKQKEAYVKTVLPERLKEWKRVKQERDDLVHERDIRSLKNAGIKNFEMLFETASFAELAWPERKKLVEEVAAHLHARKNGTERLMPEIQAELEDFRAEGILHRSKVSTWMKRIFVKNAAPEQIEQFMAKVVRPHADRWRVTRADFDTLHKQMGKNVPRGFRPLSVEAFLMKDYLQRTSYCDLLRLRLENVEEEDRQLASLKLRIRHDLDMQDWDGAEEELKKAFAIRRDDRELKSMQTFLECRHEEAAGESTEGNEEPDPLPVLQNLREMLHQIPAGTLKSCYEEALLAGPAVFHRFLQVSANHAWVVEHGYASEAENIRNAQDTYNKQKTREYVQRGHSNQMERNIVQGDTATEGAIKDDCTKAQMLYVEGDGKTAVMQKVKDNVNNESFGYWTTLVPMDVTFSLHNSVIKNLHYPLKKSLRELHKMGYRFTLAGKPEKIAV